MRFFIVDNNDSQRAIVANIIEQENLGIVVEEASDGADVSLSLLEKLQIDILIIDLLMPKKNGIELLEDFERKFSGKIIMISRIEDKQIIGDAYSLGINYYIIKPINRTEVISIIKQVSQSHQIEKSLALVNTALNTIQHIGTTHQDQIKSSESIFQSIKLVSRGIFIDLGITEEVVINDLVCVFYEINQSEKQNKSQQNSLVNIFDIVVTQKYSKAIKSQDELKKRRKAMEQRFRRAIHQALENIAALGLVDFSGIKFERYASTLFDFSQVRAKMVMLEGKKVDPSFLTQVSKKKFILGLYSLIMQEMEYRGLGKG